MLLFLLLSVHLILDVAAFHSTYRSFYTTPLCYSNDGAEFSKKELMEIIAFQTDKVAESPSLRERFETKIETVEAFSTKTSVLNSLKSGDLEGTWDLLFSTTQDNFSRNISLASLRSITLNLFYHL